MGIHRNVQMAASPFGTSSLVRNPVAHIHRSAWLLFASFCLLACDHGSLPLEPSRTEVRGGITYDTRQGRPAQVGVRKSPTEVRVVTYNTHHFGSHNSEHPDGAQAQAILHDIAWVQDAFNADIWLLQELYQSIHPNPNPFETDHMARVLEVLEEFDGVYSPENIHGRAFYKGNAVLWQPSRFEPLGGPIELRLAEGGALNDGKGAAGQVLRRCADSAELLVLSVHLDAGISARNRGLQMAELLDKLAIELEKRASLLSVSVDALPRIVGGDLNSVYGSGEPSIEHLLDEGYVGLPEEFVPTQKFWLMLDHHFARGLLSLGSRVVVEADHSDHFPVVGAFDLGSGKHGQTPRYSPDLMEGGLRRLR